MAGRSVIRSSRAWSWHTHAPHISRRYLQSTPSRIPDFAFAFDIDGVLLRSADALPGARSTLLNLQQRQIPFILLTNGGGKLEADRVAELSTRLDVPLSTDLFIQSHTPFAGMNEFKHKTVLVVGGEGDSCRHVAESYGFQSVIIPGDVLVHNPEVWPFSKQFLQYYEKIARPLPKPIDTQNPANSLKVDAIFVYNDPRDWGLDAMVVLDLLVSEQGIYGTSSPKNGDPKLPNRGWQQDGQPPLYFSNPDIWWPAKFKLPRLGQGAFREMLRGIWDATTGGKPNGVELQRVHIGKPHQHTYTFAEEKLLQHREKMSLGAFMPPLKRVYMIGDNPESDIRGGNGHKSQNGVKWSTILVKTGLYQSGEPSCIPTHISQDVHDAVKWALQQEQFT